MNEINELLHELTQAGENPRQSIAAAMKETGKKVFGCFPLYTPDEIIYAADLLPVGLWGGQVPAAQSGKYVQSFCCSIMRANLDLGIKGAYDFLEGMIIPTYCDTMKAILANWPMAAPNCNAIPFVYPQNRTSTASAPFLISQLEKFRRELEALTGTTIEDQAIEDAFTLYEDWRVTMRKFATMSNQYPKTLTPTARHLVIKASYFMDKKTHMEKVRQLISALEQQPQEIKSGPKVVLTGLMTEPTALTDLLTDCGYTVVADDLAHETRQFRTVARTEGTAIERMAYRIMDLRGCTFFYEENKSRGSMLNALAREHNADAVVVCMFKFCDPEEFDYPVYKKELSEAGVQMLYLEFEQQMDTVEQLRTRIQSFAEMVGSR